MDRGELSVSFEREIETRNGLVKAIEHYDDVLEKFRGLLLCHLARQCLGRSPCRIRSTWFERREDAAFRGCRLIGTREKRVRSSTSKLCYILLS